MKRVLTILIGLTLLCSSVALAAPAVSKSGQAGIRLELEKIVGDNHWAQVTVKVISADDPGFRIRKAEVCELNGTKGTIIYSAPDSDYTEQIIFEVIHNEGFNGQRAYVTLKNIETDRGPIDGKWTLTFPIAAATAPKLFELTKDAPRDEISKVFSEMWITPYTFRFGGEGDFRDKVVTYRDSSGALVTTEGPIWQDLQLELSSGDKVRGSAGSTRQRTFEEGKTRVDGLITYNTYAADSGGVAAVIVDGVRYPIQQTWTATGSEIGWRQLAGVPKYDYRYLMISDLPSIQSMVVQRVAYNFWYSTMYPDMHTWY